VAGGVRLRLRVQPRASRTELAGVHGDQLRVRLAAPPVDGAANAALIEFLADALHLPRRDIRIVSGQTGRRKRVTIGGMTAEQVRAMLGR